MVVKRRLDETLQAPARPIRERRAQLARHPDYLLEVLRQGTERARAVTQLTLDEVRAGLGLFSLFSASR